MEYLLGVALILVLVFYMYENERWRRAFVAKHLGQLALAESVAKTPAKAHTEVNLLSTEPRPQNADSPVSDEPSIPVMLHDELTQEQYECLIVNGLIDEPLVNPHM
jgi:hypothetical protein